MLKVVFNPWKNPLKTYFPFKKAVMLLTIPFILTHLKSSANDSIIALNLNAQTLAEQALAFDTELPGKANEIFDAPAFIPQPRQTTSVFRRKRTNVREHEFGIGGNVLGATMNYASAYLQYSLSRVLQVEGGLDLSTVYAGFNLFPKVIEKIEGLSPYMGLMIGYSDPDNLKTANGIYAYMPVGIRYLTADNWYICLELAATTADNVRSSPLFVGVKLGFLFKRD